MAKRLTATLALFFSLGFGLSTAVAADLQSVSPTCISLRGGTLITVKGSGFTRTSAIRIGTRWPGTPLADLELVDSRTIRGKTPRFTRTGPVSVQLEDTLTGKLVDTLVNALDVVMPPTLSHVMPYIVSLEGGDRVAYIGTSFCESYEPALRTIGIVPLTIRLVDPVLVNATRVDAVTPSLGRNPASFDAMLLSGEQAVATLSAAVKSMARADLPAIVSVTPSVVLPSGGEPIPLLVTGRHVSLSRMVPTIDGHIMEVLTHPNDTTWYGLLESLPEGVYDVWLIEDGDSKKIPAVLWGGFTVLSAVRDLAVEPSEIPVAGGITASVFAKNLHATTVIAIDGTDLGDQKPVLDDATGALIGFRGQAPAKSAGAKDVTATDGRGTVTFPNAVTYVAPVVPQIDSVDPHLVLADGGTHAAFLGKNFSEGLLPALGGNLLTNIHFVGSTRIEGDSPALAPGLHDAALLDATGNPVASLDGAVEAREGVALEGVEPSTVSTDGTTEVQVHGAHFHSDVVIRFGALKLLDQVVVSSTLVRGRAPAQDAGPKDVIAEDPVSSVKIPNGVTYEEPVPEVRILLVDPSELHASKLQWITFEGENFREDLVAQIGPYPLGHVKYHADARLVGRTPGMAPGVYDAVLIDPQNKEVVARLRRAFTVLEPEEVIPGPREFDTSLAEGTARFRWVNPLPYSRIVVEEPDGTPVAELPGDTTFLELDAPGRERVDLRFRGVVDEVPSQPSGALAKIHNCTRPPPLYGEHAKPGPVEFTLYGGPPKELLIPVEFDEWVFHECEVIGCVGGVGGVGGDEGDGGGADGDLISMYNIPPRNLEVQAEGTVGHIQSAAFGARIVPKVNYRSKISTGFALERPTTKLKIAAFYEKIATAADLELRGRITLVHADDPDQPLDVKTEFVFPDVLISEPPPCEAGEGGGADFTVKRFDFMIMQGKKWNDTIVMRTPPPDDDGSLVVCPDPENIQEFPAGEYLLDVFVVGGDPKLPYYIFSDDVRQFEILIPGVPCPPYPLVKITDMEGLRTLPVIDKITAEVQFVSVGQFKIRQVLFTAHGFWTDEDNACYVVDPDDQGKPLDPSADPGGDPPPLYYPNVYLENPDLTYKWRFRDYTPPLTKETSSNHMTNFMPYGCYRVDLTVTDKACGFSKTRSFQVAVVPPGLQCPQAPFDFLYPKPNPAGLYGVIGLVGAPPGGPAGVGRFEGRRPLQIRVLVVPGCGNNSCIEPPCCPAMCDAALLDECNPEQGDVLFRLAWNTPEEDDQGIQPNNRHDLFTPQMGLRLVDSCLNVKTGPKYVNVIVDDLAAIPKIEGTDGWVHVYLQGKANDGNDTWHDVHPDPINVINAPRVLDTSFWSGYYQGGDSTYHFVAKSAEETESSFDSPNSQSFEMMGMVEVPSKQNDVGAGFTSRFQEVCGQWLPEDGAGTNSGEVMSNDVNSAPLILPGSIESGGGEGGGASFLSDLMYKWCSHDVLVSGSFREDLFNAIIYTGTIGPVPVTIRAMIGLGLQYCVQSYVSVFVRPFAEDNEAHVESHFQLLSGVAIQIPAEIRADILGGIVNVSIGLKPEAIFEFDVGVHTYDATLGANYYIGAVLNIWMYFKGCIDLLFVEACVGWETLIIDGLPLIPESGNCPTLFSCEHPEGQQLSCPENRPCKEGGGGGGGFPSPALSTLQVLSAPALETHPDGTTIGTYSTSENEGYIFVGELNAGTVPGSSGKLLYRDADATFTAGLEHAEIALVSWTQLGDLSGLDLPEDPDERNELLQNDLSVRNEVSRRSNIVVSPVVDGILGWEMADPDHPAFRVSDEPGDPDYTADGRSTIAGSLQHGDAIVAWVRYETQEMLIVDGTTTIRKKVADVEPGECLSGTTGGNILSGFWCDVEVDNVRPQMELTAIYARRVNHEGPLDERQPISPDGPGINLEPTIALSPDGEVAYCVWVHDPTHLNLIDSNLGRNLYFARWHRSSDTWDPPQPVFTGDVDPNDTPGILQPSIALKGQDAGLLSFTAVQVNSDERNSGIGGGGRFVYISRLEGGVFGPPELVHRRCRVRQLGEWSAVEFPEPPLLVDPRPWKLREPDAVIHWMRSGIMGSQEASGGWMVSVIGKGMQEPTAPVNLLPEGRVQTNMAFSVGGGAVHAVHLNAGPAALNMMQGLHALEGEAHFELTNVALEPDLAIAGCEISHQFPAPGSSVKARVSVENKGLAGSAIDRDSETSIVGLRAVFLDEAGTILREVAREGLPELQPGERIEVELSLEMPHDPVRLRVEIDPNFGDRDPSNDWWECFFGAPAPTRVLCEEVPLPGRRGRTGLKVTWRAPLVYDEVLVYRNGELRTTLPGRTTVYVDQYREGIEEGEEVEYAVRGRVGASNSRRAACSYGLPGSRFIRGDSDSDGLLNITDAIFTFNYLFLGGKAPTCLRAADANGSARVDISDGVYSLNFLFLGGPPPPAPFPACGVSPEDDGLPCETQPGCL